MIIKMCISIYQQQSVHPHVAGCRPNWCLKLIFTIFSLCHHDFFWQRQMKTQVNITLLTVNNNSCHELFTKGQIMYFGGKVICVNFKLEKVF